MRAEDRLKCAGLEKPNAGAMSVIERCWLPGSSKVRRQASSRRRSTYIALCEAHYERVGLGAARVAALFR